MLVSTLAFSLMNICVKMLERIPAHQIIFFRVSISALITGVLIYRARVSPLGKQRLWLLLRGAAGALALYLYFLTIKQMPLATAVALQYMSPLFGALLAPWFVQERMGWVQWVYFLISFAGVIALKGFDGSVSLAWVLIGLASAFLTGVTSNAIRKSAGTENVLVVMIYLPFFALPISGTYALISWVPPSGWEWPLLVFTGLFTQVNQFYTTKALQSDRLERITYLNYLGLVYALIWGWFIFNEPITLGTIGAMCLIVGGVLLNFLHGLRQVKRYRLRAIRQVGLAFGAARRHRGRLNNE